MKESGRVVPVHYQEPFRRATASGEPKVEDFVAYLRGALARGRGPAGASTTAGERDAPEGQPRRPRFATERCSINSTIEERKHRAV